MELNETYDFLMQVRRKDNAIRRKELLRDELRSSLLPGAVQYGKDRVQTSPRDTLAEVIARVDEIERDVEQLRREKALLILRISDAIEQLPDEYENTVLSMFYIGREAMTEVAKGINYSARRAYDFRKQGVIHLGELLEVAS